MNEDNLMIPNEKRFLEAIEDMDYTDIRCPNCEKTYNLVLYPYAYDKDNGNMVYVAKCPNCGGVLYSRD